MWGWDWANAKEQYSTAIKSIVKSSIMPSYLKSVKADQEKTENRWSLLFPCSNLYEENGQVFLKNHQMIEVKTV